MSSFICELYLSVRGVSTDLLLQHTECLERVRILSIHHRL